MDRVACGSASMMERPERTARGYRLFRYRDRGKVYNERSGRVLNRTHYLSNATTLVALRRLRCRPTMHNLAEKSLQHTTVFSLDPVWNWETKLAPVLSCKLCRPQHGKGGIEVGISTLTRRVQRVGGPLAYCC